MLTAGGCRVRRRRLLERLGTGPGEVLVLADPVHLRYFANFHVEPFSLGADFGGVLVLRADGHAALYHDNRLPKSVEAAHADERQPVTWYTGQQPAEGPRRTLLLPVLEAFGGRVHDAPGDPLAPKIHEVVAGMRRRKDPDEVAALQECMWATQAGHAWARTNVQPGMTELDVYAGVTKACNEAAGQWVLVYGDFVVSDGPGRRTGPPTPRVLQPGELFLLDFSVVIQGYRSDFTNTIAIGGNPTPEQRRLSELCVSAMAAGERELRAGRPCQAVYDAVRGVFADAGVADAFPHHAGHGLGLGHPEPPFIVRNSTEEVVAGDVVTLEPGLYVDGVGGVRFEHNYLVTDTGFERLSDHVISLS